MTHTSRCPPRIMGEGETGGDGVEVAQEVLSEVAEAGQFGSGAGCFDAFGESVALQVSEHVGEGAHVLGELNTRT